MLRPLHLTWQPGEREAGVESRRDHFQVTQLVTGCRCGSITTIVGYPRGDAWPLPQMQGLVDSVFRKRSIPALLLHEKCNEGVFGEKLTRHEVVDGVRRIDAIDAFAGGKYPLLEPSDVRLFLPSKLRQDPAPWGGKRFADLTPELRNQFETTAIDAYVVTGATELEVRGLSVVAVAESVRLEQHRLDRVRAIRQFSWGKPVTCPSSVRSARAQFIGTNSETKFGVDGIRRSRNSSARKWALTNLTVWQLLRRWLNGF
jgi:hypothetical protein